METKLKRINRDDGIQLYHYGMEQCERGHYYGPAVRDHFLIHFIVDGKGIFKVRDKQYELSRNKAFLIVPNEITYYQADFDEPWIYMWVGFNGVEAYTALKKANLSLNQPILSYDDSCAIHGLLREMLSTDTSKNGYNLKLKGLLYLILSEIQGINTNCSVHNVAADYKKAYVDKAIDFIEKNYSRNIGVADIVKYMGLDRSYFSTIFKESLNIPPQWYLINYRMKKAAELLSSTALAVGDIARSVGYNDPLCFSKVFKKVMGVSPLKFRNSVR